MTETSSTDDNILVTYVLVLEALLQLSMFHFLLLNSFQCATNDCHPEISF